MRTTALATFFILFLGNHNSSFAVSTAKDSTITVTATGIETEQFEAPSIVNVIHNNTALTHTSMTAGGLLKGIAGLSEVGVGRTNGQTFNLRGYNKNGVLVLVDGVKQDTGMDKGSATFVDPFLIQKVEVVRGPMSSLYGSGGLGGVIDYRTANAKDFLDANEKYGFRVFTAGATGDHSYGTGAMAYGRTAQFDGLLSLTQRQRGNIYQGDGYSAPNDEGNNSLFAKGEYAIDENQSVSGSIKHYRSKSKEPGNPTVTSPSVDNSEYYHRNITQRDIQMNYHFNPTYSGLIDLNTLLYSSEVDVHSTPAGQKSKHRNSTSYGTKITNTSMIQSPLFGQQIILGGEFYHQKHQPSGAETVYPDGKINFYSGLIQDEITLRDLPLTFIIGTRYDHYQSSNSKYGDLTASNYSPKAAIVLNPTDWLMLFGSASSAFRAPTMEEMYRDGLHFYSRGKPNYWVPNPNLKPETNHSQEIGLGLTFDSVFSDGDNIELKGSYFNTHAKNYIATHVDRKKGITYANNVALAKIWGWDIQSSYEHRDFKLGLSYNHTDGIDANNREWLGNLSPDTVVTSLEIPTSLSGVSVGWRGTFVAPARHVKTGTDTQAGYVLNTFSVDYQPLENLKGVTAALVLDNALNKQANSIQGAPIAGRSVNVFVSYQW
ncbi:TonB-dependent receptor domain-containing protein [Providencia huaxiensis]|uniref:TonB-dependent receptor domain-containing protein n=1 Tax=Providencia huaxiensis TaxID=2027290 RepID=UPI0034E58CA4